LARALEHLCLAQRTTIVRIDRADALRTTAQRAVERLVERCAELPLLLLLVSDRPFWKPPFAGEEVRLHGLPEAAFLEFGTRLFRADEAPIDLLRAAWGALSGLPGGLLQSLEELQQHGQLEGRPGDFHALSPRVLELRPARPALARLREVVAALPPATRHVLQGAAVLGLEFRIDDLAALTGRPELEVLEALSLLDGQITTVDGNHG